MTAVAIAAAVTLTGCHQSGSGSQQIVGSGTPLSQTRTLAPFDALDAAGTDAVTVQVGPVQSVTVRADDNLTGHIITRVQDGTLQISDLGSFRAVTPMTVTVTVPALRRITLSGDGTLVAHDVHATQFDVQLSGTGMLRAAGTTGRLTANLAGTGDEDLSQLTAGTATARLTGTGHITVYVTSSLTATVQGTGTISYSGNPPSVVRSVTGTGSVVDQ